MSCPMASVHKLTDIHNFKDLVFILNQETLETFSEAIFEAIAFNLIYRIPIENGSEDDGKEILEGETTKRK